MHAAVCCTTSESAVIDDAGYTISVAEWSAHERIVNAASLPAATCMHARVILSLLQAAAAADASERAGSPQLVVPCAAARRPAQQQDPSGEQQAAAATDVVAPGQVHRALANRAKAWLMSIGPDSMRTAQPSPKPAALVPPPAAITCLCRHYWH